MSKAALLGGVWKPCWCFAKWSSNTEPSEGLLNNDKSNAGFSCAYVQQMIRSCYVLLFMLGKLELPEYDLLSFCGVYCFWILVTNW